MTDRVHPGGVAAGQPRARRCGVTTLDHVQQLADIARVWVHTFGWRVRTPS